MIGCKRRSRSSRNKIRNGRSFGVTSARRWSRREAGVYKDDHTDVRILGAMARILPELFSLESVQKTIMAEWKDPLKATSAARSYERTTSISVQPSQGNPETPYKFELPKWFEMGEIFWVITSSGLFMRTSMTQFDSQRTLWISASLASRLKRGLFGFPAKKLPFGTGARQAAGWEPRFEKRSELKRIPCHLD